MKSIFGEFVIFLQYDQFTSPQSRLTTWHKIVFTSRALILLLSIKIGIAVLSFLLTRGHFIDDLGRHNILQPWLAQGSTLDFLVEVVLVAPLLEELAFRGLLQPDIRLVWMGVSSLLYVLISRSLNIDYYSLSQTSLAVLTGSLGCTWLLKRPLGCFRQWVSSPTRFQTLIWVSALGFAGLHYGNYPLSGVRPQTVVAALFPHFVAGLFLSWVSLRNGLGWSIGLHMLNNALPALLILKGRV